MDTLQAVEQAARESARVFAVHAWQYVTDDRSAARYGGTNPRVARILGISTSAARDRVLKLVGEGKVLRQKSSRGSCLCWWPVGLYEKIESERNAATK